MALISSLLIALLAVQGARPFDVEDFANIDQILSALEATHGPSLQIAYNQGLDVVLDLINGETIRSNKFELHLPDIEEDFSQKVLFFTVSGSFVADRGVLADLSTVRRMGDTRLEREGSAYTVTVVVGLGTLRVRYGHYRAQLGRRGPSVSGHLDGKAGTNAIRVTTTVSVGGGNCSAVLNDLKVLDLEGLTVDQRVGVRTPQLAPVFGYKLVRREE